MRKWKSDFEKLFEDQIDFDEEFMSQVENLHSQWEDDLSDYPVMDDLSADELNVPIILAEVTHAITKCKNGKSVGIDNVPNEIIKQPPMIYLLYELFRMCFENNIVPSVWLKSIIHPILKNGKDARIPVSYRSISLMSTIAKLFNSIINTRLVKFLEEYNILSDEQNGFRKARSCVDHLYVLTTILKIRKQAGLHNYLAFVDFTRAFDTVNRKLLSHKLIINGLFGKFYRIICTMHTKLQSSIRLNNHLTEWFEIITGVRQGDNLAPTLFAMFVDDLAQSIKTANCGIPIRNERCGILMYADDVVLLAESPDQLQQCLDILHTWTRQWRLTVNTSKTKVMHCRKVSQAITRRNFVIGDTHLDLCSTYRYLGIEITENMDLAPV